MDAKTTTGRTCRNFCQEKKQEKNKAGIRRPEEVKVPDRNGMETSRCGTAGCQKEKQAGL